MRDKAVETVLLRNNFYRDNYRRVVIGLLLLLVINFCLIFALVYVVTHPEPPRYFATTSDGRIIKLQPLSEPNLPQAAILQWANQAAISSYTYDFVNYRKQLQDASEFFTPDGWRKFLLQISKSQNLNSVRDKKLVVTAVATAAPVILDQGVINGRYAWKVEMPMLVTYVNASTNIQQTLNVIMTIVRENPTNNPKGVGIAQFVAVQGSSGGVGV